MIVFFNDMFTVWKKKICFKVWKSSLLVCCRIAKSGSQKVWLSYNCHNAFKVDA